MLRTRYAAIAVLIAGLLAACSNEPKGANHPPTLSKSERAYADDLGDAFAESTRTTAFFRPTKMRCWAQRLVADVGADPLRTAGLTPAAIRQMTEFKIDKPMAKSSADQQKLAVSAFTACIDLRQEMIDRWRSLGPDAQHQTDCLEASLPEDFNEQYAKGFVYSPDWTMHDQKASAAIGAMLKCTGGAIG